MHSPQVIALIRRLLAEGRLSQRAIARHVGVSRGTVDAVADDRWAPRWGAAHVAAARVASEGRFTAPAIDEPPPIRCPGCGGLVHPPCVLCHVRGLRGDPAQGAALGQGPASRAGQASGGDRQKPPPDSRPPRD